MIFAHSITLAESSLRRVNREVLIPPPGSLASNGAEAFPLSLLTGNSVKVGTVYLYGAPFVPGAVANGALKVTQ